MCCVELCIYAEMTSAFSWTFVYFWEIIVFTHQFLVWIVEVNYICMHKSVNVLNNRKERDPSCVHFPLLLNRRINRLLVGLLAFMHVLCWIVYLAEPTLAFSWTFVYLWEVTIFMHQFLAWILEVECRCMHKSVRLNNRDDCRMDWSISWSNRCNP